MTNGKIRSDYHIRRAEMISGHGQQVVVPEKCVTLCVCRHLQNASAVWT